MRIAVIGAGVVGSLTALRLRRRGAEVHLMEQRPRGDTASSSLSAGGLLTPLAEAIYGEKSVSRLGRDSAFQWADLLSTMEEPFLLGHQGSLIVASPEAAKELEEWTVKMSRLFSLAEFRSLSPSDLAALEPAFSGMAHSGLWLENEGYLDPRGALRAIYKTLEKEGAALTFETTVQNLTNGGVTANGSFVRYDRVIDTRGLGAQVDWPELRGVRGEALVVEAPDVTLRYPMRILHARHPIYIVPRGSGSYYVGATSIESESVAPIQVQSLLEILTNLATFHPGFRYAHVKECIAQVRPTLDDHLPRIRVDQGVVRVNGLYRHGFLLGPMMSQAVCDLVLGDPDKNQDPKMNSPNHFLHAIERTTP